MHSRISSERSCLVRTGLVLAVACALAASLRLGMWLPNIAAVGALGLYSGSRLSARFAWLPPIGVMVVTDLLLNRWFGFPPFNRSVYACFVASVILGRLALARPTATRVFGAGIANSLLFFAVTNFMVWWKVSAKVDAIYPPTLNGLLACYTAALPFLQYTLVGDLMFAGVFFGLDAVLSLVMRPAMTESN